MNGITFFSDEAEAREFALWLALQPRTVIVKPHHKLTPNIERVMVEANFDPSSMDSLRRQWDAR